MSVATGFAAGAGVVVAVDTAGFDVVDAGAAVDAAGFDVVAAGFVVVAAGAAFAAELVPGIIPHAIRSPPPPSAFGVSL